jgi:Rrf2 family transcriptional regulator, cysteine metabolism repressor
MNISSKGQYALHAIFDLASQQPGAPVRIASIAKRQNIPQKFLEAILASLKQGGFVESRRGAEGGYYLARSPDSITIGDVLRYMDGLPSPKQKTARRETPFGEVWQHVDETVSGILDHADFASIVRNWAKRQKTYVPDWEI